MKTTKEMLNSVIELKTSNKIETWFDVDEYTSIFVEIFSYEDGEIKVAIEWRNIDTNDTYESVICDYEDNDEIENALDYIRRCALDGR